MREWCSFSRIFCCLTLQLLSGKEEKLLIIITADKAFTGHAHDGILCQFLLMVRPYRKACIVKAIVALFLGVQNLRDKL
jgi:hypothetical protein